MGGNRLHKGHAVPDFVGSFELDLKRLASRIEETRHLLHRGAKGDERESPVGDFLKKVLPPKYSVAKGEIVDLFGSKSPQFDVLIFDRQRNFPLYEGQTVVLAAEALLTVGEVKSALCAAEVERTVNAARKLKSLRPFKNMVADPHESGTDRSKRARYLHFLFAYDTDLVFDTWPANELARLERYQEKMWVDLVYVLGRGLINVRARTYIPESQVGANALVVLWYSIQNFLERENGRRGATPYFSYANDLNRFWQPIT